MIHPKQDPDGATAISGRAEVQKLLALTFCPPHTTTAQTEANCGRKKGPSYHHQEQPTGPDLINEDADLQ